MLLHRIHHLFSFFRLLLLFLFINKNCFFWLALFSGRTWAIVVRFVKASQSIEKYMTKAIFKIHRRYVFPIPVHAKYNCQYVLNSKVYACNWFCLQIEKLCSLQYSFFAWKNFHVSLYCLEYDISIGNNRIKCFHSRHLFK